MVLGCFLEFSLAWVLGPLALLLLYIYGRYPFYVWHRLSVDGPPPKAFLGNTPELYSPSGGYNVIGKWQKKYGRVVGIYLGRSPVLVIMDPALMKEVFVKDFGNFSERSYSTGTSIINKEASTGIFFVGGQQWKRLRTIMTPAFSGNKLKLLTTHIRTCAERFGSAFLQAAEGGEEVDVKKVSGGFSMNVISTSAFSLDVNTQSDLDEPLVKHGRGLFEFSTLTKIALLLRGALPHIFGPLISLTGMGFFNSKDINFFNTMIHQMIKDRKAETGSNKRVDILQMLIDAEAQDAEIDAGSAKMLSSEEIVAQCLVLFIAGYETTSTTLQFMLYELARRPDVQQRLVKEMDDVIGDQEPTYELCQELKFMEATIKETLRMYPPLTQITRKAKQATKLGSTAIPEGAGIMIPVFNINRDPMFYDDPDDFNPDRFTEGCSRAIDPVTFLSFGFGPRLCLGMRLGMLELRMGLVYLLKNVRLVSATPKVLKLKDFATLLRPDQMIKVKVEKRN